MNRSDAAKKSQQKAQATVDQLWGEILAELSPICLEAVNLFNKSQEDGGGTQIKTDDIEVTVSPKDKTLSMFVKLIEASGSEPEEDYDLGDPDRIIDSKLRPILENLFSEKKIPLSFSGVKVPSFYYMK